MHQSRYLSNFATIRKYNDHTYKVVSFQYSYDTAPDLRQKVKKGSRNSKKLDNNISRAKSKIFDLAASNSWEYFVTFTLNSENYDRENLEIFRKDFSKKITNYNHYHHVNIQYLLIPEEHKDEKSWHFHGLMRGIPKEMLVLFTPDMHLPYSILDKLKKGECVYDWPFYSNHFGFCNIESVRDPDKVCGYITKYITKDLVQSVSRLNSHCYYASKGLKRSEIIKRGELVKDFIPDFKNEYIKSKTFSSAEEALSFFESDNSTELSGFPFLSYIEKGERKILDEIL